MRWMHREGARAHVGMSAVCHWQEPAVRRYCRFYRGRRTDDDERQIKRWRGVAGEKGRWKRALVNRCLKANK